MKYPLAISSDSVEVLAPSRDAQRPGGGSAPQIVIRGETPPPTHTTPSSDGYAQSAFVDYLAFTFTPGEEFSDIRQLRDVLVDVFNIPCIGWVKAKNGWQGYREKYSLDFYGFVAYGGISQRGTVHVELKGQGCAQISDWRLVHDYLLTVDARLTRVDVAHDDFAGAYINIENALKWEASGAFAGAGRPPTFQLYDDRGSGKGKTFYIGSRTSSKYTRIYEKGKKAGDPSSPWCRVEVEYKSKDRVLPFEILLAPGSFLAGAHQPFESLCPTQSRIQTNLHETEATMKSVTEWGRTVCGQLINLLCILHKNDYAAVIRLMQRPGIPPRLEPYYKRYLMARDIEP